MSKKQDAKCKYLIDTSALYPLVLSGKVLNPEQYAVTSLTEYELGNVLWKESRTRKIDFKAAARTFSNLLLELKKININGLEGILVLALERNLTFYDASYAAIAEKEGLILVTEDLELLKKCKMAISTEGIEGT
jgi:predicted nucleic acid-binding protein